MKHFLFKIALLFAFSALCQNAFAARYTWSQFDLTFDTPDNGFVTYNSPRRFELAWDDLNMSIHLYNKDGITDEKLKLYLQRSANGYNMYDTKIKKYKVNTFKGFVLEGTLPDGSRARLAYLVSNKNDLCLNIEVNYLLGDEKRVDSIFKSFTEGKKQELKQEKPLKQKIQKKGAKPKPIKTNIPPEELFEA